MWSCSYAWLRTLEAFSPTHLLQFTRVKSWRIGPEQTPIYGRWMISMNRTYKLINYIAASLCWRKRRAWMNGWMCALCFTLSIWQTLAGAGVLPWWYERGMKEQQGLPNRTGLLRKDKMRSFLSASHKHRMPPQCSHACNFFHRSKSILSSGYITTQIITI